MDPKDAVAHLLEAVDGGLVLLRLIDSTIPSWRGERGYKDAEKGGGRARREHELGVEAAKHEVEGMVGEGEEGCEGCARFRGCGPAGRKGRA